MQRASLLLNKKAELVSQIENKTPHRGEAMKKIGISDNLTSMSINERISRRVSFKVGMVFGQDLPKIGASMK